MRHQNPGTVEEFVENRLCDMVAADVAGLVPPAKIFAARTFEPATTEPALVISCDRGAEISPFTGWYDCLIEAELDLRGMTDREASQAWAGIETALGSGDTDQRFAERFNLDRVACMARSETYDETQEHDQTDEGTFRTFRFSGVFGIFKPTP